MHEEERDFVVQFSSGRIKLEAADGSALPFSQVPNGNLHLRIGADIEDLIGIAVDFRKTSLSIRNGGIGVSPEIDDDDDEMRLQIAPTLRFPIWPSLFKNLSDLRVDDRAVEFFDEWTDANIHDDGNLVTFRTANVGGPNLSLTVKLEELHALLFLHDPALGKREFKRIFNAS